MLQPQPANRLEHKSRANGWAVVRVIEFFSLNLLSYLSFSFCKDKHILKKNKIFGIISAHFADFDIIFDDFETTPTDNTQESEE